MAREANRIRREDAREHEEEQRWQEHLRLCMDGRHEPIATPATDPCREIIHGVEHEWVPGTTQLTRPANLSCTFRPSPNFYGALACTMATERDEPMAAERGEPVAVPLTTTDYIRSEGVAFAGIIVIAVELSTRRRDGTVDCTRKGWINHPIK